MTKFNVFQRLCWTFLLALTLGLAGCDGDDGAAGAAGSNGTDGADGTAGLACWDLNGNGLGDLPDEDLNGDGVVDVKDCAGASASATPLESCGVCHDTGSIADAGAAHALPPIEAVSNITVAAVGADLAVTFDLAADGVPATNYDEVQRAYFTDGVTRTDFRDPVTGELTVATLTNNTGGNYTITVAGAGPEAANNNRWLFRVGVAGDRETRVYFYADTGVSPVEDLAISAQACNACHGPEGIDVHGGYFAAEDGGEPCLVCHGVDTVPSLAVVAHGYHSSIWEEENPRGSGNFEVVEVTYPTYMNNCSVCHSEDAQLAAVNAMSVSGAGCFSCHGSLAGLGFEEGNFHYSITDPETADCTVCHGAGGVAASLAAVTDFHNGSTTERGGVIWDGVDTSVTEGAKIAWTITGVADDGTDLTITWEATYDGVGVDPCNDTPAAGEPAFFAIPPFLFAGDTEPDDRNNLSILRNYAQGEDFILGTHANRAGQPDGDVDVDDSNTTCAGNVATTVAPVEETDAMYGRVAIQGKPWVVAADPDDEDGVMQVRAKTPTYDWVIGDGSLAPARRAVADTSLCLSCHVGSLYQHGGNRVDNIDMCYLCHNAAANDEYVRVDSYGVDSSEAYDGRAGQAFGIKEMVHSVHPAGATGNPVVIYRGRGIYAWADDVSKLSNWPAGDWPGDIPGLPVFGSDDGTGNPVLQTHHYHEPTYPRGLYDCAACHVATVNILPDKTKAMATTVEAGQPPFGDQLNDVLQGVQSSSCVTCHADSASKGHANQNAWTPQVFPEGRQTIIDAN